MRLRGRPTVETLGVLLAVFALQWVLGLVAWSETFVLAPPVTHRPWTAVTSVYAHADLGHLAGNAVLLAVVGPFVARRTGRLAFHGLFVATGTLSALAEVVLGGLLWTASPVLGASGAVFALVGYLVAGNVVSQVLLDRLALSARTQLVALLVVAVAVTLATAGERTALFGHVTGLVCGVVAGRFGLAERSRAP